MLGKANCEFKYMIREESAPQIRMALGVANYKEQYARQCMSPHQQPFLNIE